MLQIRCTIYYLTICAVWSSASLDAAHQDHMGLSSPNTTSFCYVTYGSKSDQLVLKAGRPSGEAVGWGSFEDTLNVTGWGILNVRTSSGHTDEQQYKAAGMVEGFLTAKHIYTAYLNALGYVFKNNVSAASIKFLSDQMQWTREQVETAYADALWKNVGSLVAQFDGLVEGYGIAAKQGIVPPLDVSALLILNGVGDLFQIMPAVDLARRPDFDAMNSKELRRFVKENGMCSALIKVPGNYEDLFMAHSSWFAYGDMDRIFKHYHFQHQDPNLVNRVSFSSYPGYLESLDDFYMMDSGLGMVQTSNNLMNTSLYKLIKPQSLLAWQRVRLANMVAKSGKEWYEAFSFHASGTYVNQYMIVNFNLFKPKTALLDGTLWVVEEIPGLVVGADQTETLRRGYWPSYNVPYYPEIYQRSGYTDSRLGPDGDYQLAPRAKIFRRDNTLVVDMESYKRVMRHANYSDPYALDENGDVDYSAAICMRGDLANKGNGRAGGCYDTKVTSYLHGFQNLSAEIVNGPSSSASTTSNNPPFAWRLSDQSTPHFGVPQMMKFDFVTTKPWELPGPTLAQQGTVYV